MSYQTNNLAGNTWEYTYTVNNTLSSAIELKFLPLDGKLSLIYHEDK